MRITSPLLQQMPKIELAASKHIHALQNACRLFFDHWQL
jgi:hypothetical protein